MANNNANPLPKEIMDIVENLNWQTSEVKCTCEELSKHRALCPICDKEEYERMKQYAWNEKKK